MRFTLSSAGRFFLATILLAGPAAAQDATGAIGGDERSRQPTFVEPEPLPQYEAGMKALHEGQFRAARIAFNMVLRSVDNNPKILVLAGVAYVGEGNQASAMRYFKAAIRSDAQFIPAYQELGILHAKRGEREEAQKQLAELNRMSASCGGTCAKAGELKIAINEVNAALGA